MAGRQGRTSTQGLPLPQNTPQVTLLDRYPDGSKPEPLHSQKILLPFVQTKDHQQDALERLLSVLTVLSVLQVGPTLLPHGRAGYRQLSDLSEQETRPRTSGSGLEFLLAAYVPVNSYQQEDVPHGGYIS